MPFERGDFGFAFVAEVVVYSQQKKMPVIWLIAETGCLGEMRHVEHECFFCG